MSTDARPNFLHVLALAAGAVLLATGYYLVHPHNPSMAKGLVQGGVVGLLLVALAFWRAERSPSASSAERTMAWVADERDHRVVEKALAIAGLASFGWMSAAALAIGVGVLVEMAIALMLWGQLLTLVGAYLWRARRG